MPKKFLKILTTLQIFYILFFIFYFAAAPLPARAAGATRSWADDSMPDLSKYVPDLQIDIGKFTSGDFTTSPKCTLGSDGKQYTCEVPWIGEYMTAIYSYAIGIVGILATVVMMVGGIVWLTAGGNTTRVGEAKSWIGASVTGLLIALCSYLILYQINPSLIKFNPIKVKIAKEMKGVTGEACSWKLLTSDDTGKKTCEEEYSDMTTASDESQCGDKGTLSAAYGCCCSRGAAAYASLLLSKASSSGECKDSSGTAVSPYKNLQQVIDGTAATACNSSCKSGAACTGSANISENLLKAVYKVSSNSFTITSIAGGQHSGSNDEHYQGKGMDISPASATLVDLLIAQGVDAYCENTWGKMTYGKYKGTIKTSSSDVCSGDHIHIKSDS